MVEAYVVKITKTDKSDMGGFGLSVSHCPFEYEWVGSKHIKFTNSKIEPGYRDKITEWLDEHCKQYNCWWNWETDN